MKKVIFYLFALLSVITSCRTIKHEEKQPYTEKLLLEKKQIAFLKIKADFEVNFPDFSQNFSSEIRIAGNDSLLITIFGPFGMTVGKLYADANDFVFYNVFENVVIKGKSDEKSFEKAIRFNLNFNDFLSILKNEPLGDINFYRIYENKNDTILFIKIEDNYIDFIMFSVIQNGILRYERKNMLDEKIFDVVCKNFEKTEFGNFAKYISINIPKDKGKINIGIEQIEINDTQVKSLPFKFSTPSKTKYIVID